MDNFDLKQYLAENPLSENPSNEVRLKPGVFGLAVFTDIQTGYDGVIELKNQSEKDVMGRLKNELNMKDLSIVVVDQNFDALSGWFDYESPNELEPEWFDSELGQYFHIV